MPLSSEATCISGDSESSIDYFVISKCLANFVQRAGIDERATVVRTHRPVQIELRSLPRDAQISRWRRCKSIPVARPIGADREPPQYSDLRAGFDELVAELHAGNTRGMDMALDATYLELAGRVETEIFGRYDLL